MINKYTEVNNKEVKKQVLRLANLSPGAKPGQTNLKAMVNLERDLMDEGMSSITKGYASQNLKAIETGQLKLDLASRLSDTIDDRVSSQVINTYKDPRIIDFLEKVGNKNLVDDYMNAQSVSDVRALQKSFVRMSKIIDLSDQLPSSLGGNYFKWLNQIPGIGPAIEGILSPLSQTLLTSGARAGQSLSQGVGNIGNRVTQPVSQAGSNVVSGVSQFSGQQAPVQSVINPATTAIQRALQKENEVKQQRKVLPGAR